MLIILTTATELLFLCWDLRVKQWLQDLSQDLFRQPRWIAFVEIALKTWLTYLFQTTHTLQLPTPSLIKQGKSVCLTRLEYINCLNLNIYSPDKFLHWTRISCQVSFSSHFWIHFFHSAGKKWTNLVAGYDSPSKIFDISLGQRNLYTKHHLLFLNLLKNWWRKSEEHMANLKEKSF